MPLCLAIVDVISINKNIFFLIQIHCNTSILDNTIDEIEDRIQYMI